MIRITALSAGPWTRMSGRDELQKNESNGEEIIFRELKHYSGTIEKESIEINRSKYTNKTREL